MTLKLQLTPELEERLRREAEKQGVPADECTLRLLDEYLPGKERSANLERILKSWMDKDDAEEQKETGEYLIRVLDEDRLSDRKLFPAELKGTSW
jgi:hypothetical protein